MTDLGQAVAWHRQIAALVDAADRAGLAPSELPALRARLFAQQSAITQAAARVGAPLPALVPTPTEIAAVTPAFGDLSEPAVARALHSAGATLDAVDAALQPTGAAHTPQPAAVAPLDTTLRVPQPPPAVFPAGYPAPGAAPAPAPAPAQTRAPAPGPGTVPVQYPGYPSSAAPPAYTGGGEVAPQPNHVLQNGLIYGAYAFGVVIIQVLLFFLLDEQSALPSASPVCLLVLPAFAWAAGWFTIGARYPSPPGETRSRNPRLGAFICLLPDLLLCGYLAVLVALDLAHR